MVVDGVDVSAEKIVHRGGGRGVTPDLSSVGDLLSREAQHDLGTRNRHPASKHSPHNRTQNSKCVASLGEHKGNERERDRKGKAK